MTAVYLLSAIVLSGLAAFGLWRCVGFGKRPELTMAAHWHQFFQKRPQVQRYRRTV